MDIVRIALVILGLCVFGWLVMTAIFKLVALADKAHRLAWMPLLGLLFAPVLLIGS